MKRSYEDMLFMPHHVSEKRRRMSASERAAQFSPFSALTGLGAQLGEAARLTQERREPGEDEELRINARLAAIASRSAEHPSVCVVYFVPDGLKPGGSYVTVSGRLQRVDEYARALVLRGGARIPIDDIFDIEELDSEEPEA